MPRTTASSSFFVILHKLGLGAFCLYQLVLLAPDTVRLVTDLLASFEKMTGDSIFPLMLFIVRLLIPCLILHSLYKPGPGPYHRVRNLLCLALALQLTNVFYLFTFMPFDGVIAVFQTRLHTNPAWVYSICALIYLNLYFHISSALREQALRPSTASS